MFLYPFGAVVFRDVPPPAREEEPRKLPPEAPTPQVAREELTVREEPGAPIRPAEGAGGGRPDPGAGRHRGPHLPDKPDAAWEDHGMDLIYDDLRSEFDLGERYAAMESKLRSAQEALELILDVARDRRLVILELAIVALIVLEVVLGLL